MKLPEVDLQTVLAVRNGLSDISETIQEAGGSSTTDEVAQMTIYGLLLMAHRNNLKIVIHHVTRQNIEPTASVRDSVDESDQDAHYR